MEKKNPKVKKFELEFERNYGDNNEFSSYKIVGLDCAYTRHNYGANKIELDSANGACGLLKQEKYPGYCQLCFVYHTEGSEHFVDGYTVEFMPLLTKDSERILIKYDYDCTMATFRCGHMIDEKKRCDATITFFNKGVCNSFD